VLEGNGLRSSGAHGIYARPWIMLLRYRGRAVTAFSRVHRISLVSVVAINPDERLHLGRCDGATPPIARRSISMACIDTMGAAGTQAVPLQHSSLSKLSWPNLLSPHHSSHTSRRLGSRGY